MRRGCDGGRGVTASPSPRDSETASAAPSASSGLRTPDAAPGLLGIGSVVKRSTLGRARVPAGPDSGGWAAARGRGCSSARRAGVLFVSQLGGRRSPARRRHAAGNLIVAAPRADRRPRARQPLRFQSVVCEPRRDRSLRCSDVCLTFRGAASARRAADAKQTNRSAGRSPLEQRVRPRYHFRRPHRGHRV